MSTVQKYLLIITELSMKFLAKCKDILGKSMVQKCFGIDYDHRIQSQGVNKGLYS